MTQRDRHRDRIAALAERYRGERVAVLRRGSPGSAVVGVCWGVQPTSPRVSDLFGPEHLMVETSSQSSSHIAVDNVVDVVPAPEPERQPAGRPATDLTGHVAVQRGDAQRGDAQ